MSYFSSEGSEKFSAGCLPLRANDADAFAFAFAVCFVTLQADFFGFVGDVRAFAPALLLMLFGAALLQVALRVSPSRRLGPR